MSDIFDAPEAGQVQQATAVTEYGSIEKAIAGDYEFTIKGVLKEGWEKTKGAKWAIHMAFFWYLLVAIAVMVLAQLSMMTVVSNISDPTMIMIVGIGQQIVFNLILLPMTVGIFILGIKRSVDAPLESMSVFDYFSKMGSLLVTMILVYIMIIIGYVLLIIPGIYLSFAYFMSMPLVVEKNMSPWQAMETSRKAITKRWFSFFFLMIILGIIMMISIIPLGIGMIWTVPMMFVCFGVLYRNMFGVEGKTLA